MNNPHQAVLQALADTGSTYLSLSDADTHILLQSWFTPLAERYLKIKTANGEVYKKAVKITCQTVDDRQQPFGPEWEDWAIVDDGVDALTHVRVSGIEIFRRRFTLLSKNPPYPAYQADFKTHLRQFI